MYFLPLLAQSVKNPPALWETWVRFPGLGRPPGGGHGNPHQYSCLENPHGQKNLAAAVHGVAESQTRPSTQHSTVQATSYPLGSWKK